MEEELLSLDDVHQFTYLSKMKQALTEIKINAVIQFIKDTLDVENKLVTFVFHTQMYETLMSTFGNQCVGINGGLSDFKRQDAVTKFQKNDDIKQFIGQLQAASTGITLTASHIMIFTEWGQTAVQMEQACDRIHRIGQESDRCLYYYLIVKDTIDEGPMETLTKHYNDIQAVLNGNTDIKFVDIDESMIVNVKSRRLMKGRQGVQIEYS
jgi:SWI/SNF-related matrix-associated actin-dependent regulator 1 of chromatin subfamily A